jgi:glyoxylase-like metal-dependent hydrolase (beta-lactamase superfamily II)
MGLSRREFMKGLALTTMGAAAGAKLVASPMTVAAQSAAAAASFYRMSLGSFELTVIRDGLGALPVSTLAANAESGEISDLLAANGIGAGDTLPNNFKILVVNTGSDLVVFDTGRGAAADGQLLPTLALLGIEPGDVSTVVLSHWHGDHVGGVSIDGAPAFPGAQYLMTRGDYDLLQSDPSNQGFAGALAALQPVMDAGSLEFYNAGDEILTGINAVAAPGHTPGHSAFMISSDGQSLLNTVDAIIHPVISVQRTGWHFGFDADRDQAVATRRSLLERIAGDNLLMFGYHFPFPGIGVVGAADEADTFRFTPFSY